MSEVTQSYKDAIKNFAGSKLFFKVFDETIALVQRASDYLEGAGRFDQVRLEGKAASSFATESVKMTNRLMHVSSWLLAHRAYFKGDIDAPREIDLNEFLEFSGTSSMDKLMSELPTRFVVLVTQSNLLFERILRLDEQLKNIPEALTDKAKAFETDVHSQLDRIKAGLGLEMKKEKDEGDNIWAV